MSDDGEITAGRVVIYDDATGQVFLDTTGPTMWTRFAWTVWGWFNHKWVPARVYYRVGQALGCVHDGWRPLSTRYPEQFKKIKGHQ